MLERADLSPSESTLAQHHSATVKLHADSRSEPEGALEHVVKGGVKTLLSPVVGDKQADWVAAESAHYGLQLASAVPLFAGTGRMAWTLSAAINAATAVKVGESTPQALASCVLGAGKGLALKASLEGLNLGEAKLTALAGKLPETLTMPTKGVLLGGSSAFADTAGTRHSYLDARGTFDVGLGLSRAADATFNLENLAVSSATMVAGGGILYKIGLARPALMSNRLFANAATGFSFGSVSGGLGEWRKQSKEGEFHPGKIFVRALLGGTADAAGAAVGAHLSAIPVRELSPGSANDSLPAQAAKQVAEPDAPPTAKRRIASMAQLESLRDGAQGRPEHVSRLLPPDSVERFHERLTEMLRARTEQVDLPLLKRLASEAQKEQNLAYLDLKVYDEGGAQTSKRQHLADDDPGPKRQSQDGEALFDTFLEKGATFQQLKQSIQAEYQLRKKELTRIVNEEAPSLYPDRIVPRFKVQTAPLRAWSEIEQGSYKAGQATVELHHAFLERPLSDLTPTLAHEIQHGVDDALLIHKYIDEFVKDNNREPTKEDHPDITSRYLLGTHGSELSSEMLSNIIQKRAGRLLTQEQHGEADLVERSFQKLLDTHERPHEAYVRMKQLGRHLLGLSGNAQSHAQDIVDLANSDPAFVRMLFGRSTPGWFSELMAARKHTETESDSSAGMKWMLPSNTERVHAAVRTAYDSASSEYDAGLKSYRNWYHEQKARDVGGEVNELTQPSPYPPFEIAVLLDGLIRNTQHRDNIPLVKHLLERAHQQETRIFKVAYRHIADVIAEHPQSLAAAPQKRQLTEVLRRPIPDHPDLSAAYEAVADELDRTAEH